jgi:hypothetical protein
LLCNLPREYCMVTRKVSACVQRAVLWNFPLACPPCLPVGVPPVCTEQEVFLRLAAQNKGVNYTDEDFSTHEATPAAAAGPRTCVLCGTAKPELVTLFTIKVGAAPQIHLSSSVRPPRAYP